MGRQRTGKRKTTRQDASRGGYVVIVRGPNGRPRVERVRDAAAYRARLASAVQADAEDGLSIDELATLLDS